ncbi:MAG: low-specificity L-threonine aldolase [Desulfopila sp.]
MNRLDLRSDTVTRPTKAMLAAMNSAEVGDDVYGEDATTNRLEEKAAHILGKEAALFCPSGTQSNLAALLTHCGRGDEYIVGQHAHTYKYEGGGAAVFGSIQPQPLDLQKDGTFDLNMVEQHIKADDFHFARSRLLCLENTHGGLALPHQYLIDCHTCARKNNLGLHLDGARLFNAARKWDVAPRTIAQVFDSVSICLSKGLGAPIGSLLCGGSDFIAEARRWRKVLGGGMRQTGCIAAAGVYALDNNITRLSEDQHNAEALARSLARIDELEVCYDTNQTNMIFIGIPQAHLAALHVFLRQRGIIMAQGENVRLVTHLEISRRDIDTIAQAFHTFFSRQH